MSAKDRLRKFRHFTEDEAYAAYMRVWQRNVALGLNNPGPTYKELADELDTTPQTAGNLIRQLIKSDRVRRTEWGTHRAHEPVGKVG